MITGLFKIYIQEKKKLKMGGIDVYPLVYSLITIQ